MRAYDSFKATVLGRKAELEQSPVDSKTVDVQAREVPQREPGSDDAELQADFQRQMAKEQAA